MSDLIFIWKWLIYWDIMMSKHCIYILSWSWCFPRFTTTIRDLWRTSMMLCTESTVLWDLANLSMRFQLPYVNLRYSKNSSVYIQAGPPKPTTSGPRSKTDHGMRGVELPLAREDEDDPQMSMQPRIDGDSIKNWRFRSIIFPNIFTASSLHSKDEFAGGAKWRSSKWVHSLEEGCFEFFGM